ncbi:MAG TPA: hypothetical protein VGM33_02885 [Baekduia sp.]|jgi:hypothetical protein
MLVGCIVALFSIRRLVYTLDAQGTYAWLFSRRIVTQPQVDLRLIDEMAGLQRQNRGTIERLRLCLTGASGGFIVFIAGLAAAVALGS